MSLTQHTYNLFSSRPNENQILSENFPPIYTTKKNNASTARIIYLYISSHSHSSSRERKKAAPTHTRTCRTVAHSKSRLSPFFFLRDSHHRTLVSVCIASPDNVALPVRQAGKGKDKQTAAAAAVGCICIHIPMRCIRPVHNRLRMSLAPLAERQPGPKKCRDGGGGGGSAKGIRDECNLGVAYSRHAIAIVDARMRAGNVTCVRCTIFSALGEVIAAIGFGKTNGFGSRLGECSIVRVYGESVFVLQWFDGLWETANGEKLLHVCACGRSILLKIFVRSSIARNL